MTRHHCGVCGDMAYFGGVQGGRTAKRVDAKTVVVGATNELWVADAIGSGTKSKLGAPPVH
jgi:hypothetical protein